MDGGTKKARSVFQIDWYLTHSGRYPVDHPELLTHPKMSWTKADKLNFRQAKKLAKRYGWRFLEDI